jgi:rhomboid protease GluP
MSNIRGLNDRRGDEESRPLNGGGPSNWGVSKQSARDESFCGALQVNFCPDLTKNSFTWIISIVDVVVFCISLGLGMSSSEFLAPSDDALFNLGEKYPYYMKNQFQIWRFVTPVFLHASFMHIVMNLVSQLILGSIMEKLLGTSKFIVVYFTTAIGGVLFSSLVTDTPAVGASTAILGLIGAQIAYLFMNWSHFREEDKCRFIVYTIIFMLIALSLSGHSAKVD